MPSLYILADPKAAGKTTASQILLPEVFNTDIFIYADIIAGQLNPAIPESVAFNAGRIILERMGNCINELKIFI